MAESFEKQSEQAEDVKKNEGIIFVTPLGESFSKIEINCPGKDLSVLMAFPDREKLKDIVIKSRNFKKDFPKTFNGILLGNPEISVQSDGSLYVKAEKLHYQTYFAAHELRKEKPGELDEKYCALSVCGIVYDTKKHCFYMSVRPSDSQEDAGKIDAPGGVLSPDFENANPFKTADDRFNKKLGLKGLRISSIGIVRIFNEKHSLYDIVMYGEVEDKEPSIDQSKFIKIPLSKAGEYLESESLTSPARATLLLVLSQDRFKDAGWGKERVDKTLIK